MIKVMIYASEVAECIHFAKKAAKNQNAYGRSLAEVEKDTVIGKLGEAAVVKFFNYCGIEAEVNAQVYQKGQCDDADIICNKWPIDVKTTQQNPACLRVAWSALDFRADTKKLSDYYVLTRLDPSLKQFTAAQDTWVDLLGYWDVEEFTEGNPKVKIQYFRKGTRKEPFFVVHEDLLAKNFEKLAYVIKNTVYDQHLFADNYIPPRQHRKLSFVIKENTKPYGRFSLKMTKEEVEASSGSLEEELSLL